MIKKAINYLVKVVEDKEGTFEYNNIKYTIHSTNNQIDAPESDINNWFEIPDLSDENIISIINSNDWEFPTRLIRLVIRFEDIGVLVLYYPELFMLIKNNQIPFKFKNNVYYVYLEFINEQDRINLESLGIKIDDKDEMNNII
jgi:hypothetical protein